MVKEPSLEHWALPINFEEQNFEEHLKHWENKYLDQKPTYSLLSFSGCWPGTFFFFYPILSLNLCICNLLYVSWLSAIFLVCQTHIQWGTLYLATQQTCKYPGQNINTKCPGMWDFKGFQLHFVHICILASSRRWLSKYKLKLIKIKQLKFTFSVTQATFQVLHSLEKLSSSNVARGNWIGWCRYGIWAALSKVLLGRDSAGRDEQ